MLSIPIYISVIFALTTALTLFIFYRASFSRRALLVLTGWAVLQAIVSLSGFYTITNTLPPRFVLLVAPTLLTIIFLFVTNKGKAFIDSLRTDQLTLLHIVRVPVEIVLYLLFTYKAVPVNMTFEGQNLDILAGLTSPLVWYFGYVKKKINKPMLVAWNLVCLCLLLNIVITAVLAAPFPFQQIAFDQPNIAVLYFPFTWLPCLVVPLVLFSHLVCLRKLSRGTP